MRSRLRDSLPAVVLLAVAVACLGCATSHSTAQAIPPSALPPPASPAPPPEWTYSPPPVVAPTPLPDVVTLTTEPTYEPAWTQVVSAALEPAGYGLYTYVLIRQKPQTADEIDTALHSIERLLYATDPVAKALVGSAPQRINLVVFPVGSIVAPLNDRRKLAQSLLDVYDHTRAKRLLNRLHATGNGPYLVSSLRPLDRGKPAQDRVLVQYLSGARRAYLNEWIDHFVERASAPTDWTTASLRETLMNTRDYLEFMGANGPPVARDLRRIVRFVSELTVPKKKTAGDGS